MDGVRQRLKIDGPVRSRNCNYEPSRGNAAG
jgi:hypothetical protein